MNNFVFDDRAQQVMQKIHQAGFDAWFVGGCVRDALIAKSFGDYDIATSAYPEDIKSLLNHEFELDFKGAKFGCVRVLNNDLWLEVTTLREDTQTDGRHAKVTFTKDLAKDAARRDFTINALYWHGAPHAPSEIVDFYGGQEDLAKGRVQFIGNPDLRVEEDYLRILRFFRFSANYALDLDESGLNACTDHQGGLQYLSGERVWCEWSKTLFGKNTLAVLEAINAQSIDMTLFGGKINTRIYNEYQGYDPLLVTSLLLPTVRSEHLAHRLNLSNAQKDWLKIAIALGSDCDFRMQYVEHGQRARELVYFWACTYQKNSDEIFTQDFWNTKTPVFPLGGKDIINLGCQPGPIVGKYLERARQWWAQNNFKPSYRDCLEYAQSLFNK